VTGFITGCPIDTGRSEVDDLFRVMQKIVVLWIYCSSDNSSNINEDGILLLKG
jgi:hypothetical protein